MKIENYLNLNRNKRLINKESHEIIQDLEFKFMKDFYEIDFNESIMNQLIELIESIKFRLSIKNISYSSLRNFKNISHKKLNMRIFYYENENNNYEIYLSFNLNNRNFSSQRLYNQSKKDLFKILLDYKMKENQKKIS
jgi:hypothetical protein